jgi:class 3 adenylate cyclase
MRPERSGLSAPGEFLVSETLRSPARTPAAILFEDQSRRKLKGVAEPARLWAMRTESHEPCGPDGASRQRGGPALSR